MRRSITAETALRLSKHFGNSAEFWLGLQNDYNLEENRIALRKQLESIRTLTEPNAAKGYPGTSTGVLMKYYGQHLPFSWRHAC
jgi:hypothetical protein